MLDDIFFEITEKMKQNWLFLSWAVLVSSSIFSVFLGSLINLGLNLYNARNLLFWNNESSFYIIISSVFFNFLITFSFHKFFKSCEVV